MFCPNCGSRNNKKQNYCRFCGLNLRDTTKSLISQLAFGEDSGLVKSLSSVRRVIDLALAALAGVVIVCGVAYFFFGASFGRGVMRTGMAVFFLLQLILGAVGYYQRKERGKARGKRFEQKEAKRLGPQEAVAFLEEKPFEAAPNVVERTTELLRVESKTRKLD